MQCPKCNDTCKQESVDIGVGVIYGPWGCPSCAWCQDSTYDLSEDQSPIRSDGVVFDQYGCLYPRDNLYAIMVRQELERADEEGNQ